MKISRDQLAQNRAAILKAASGLFRERGPTSVSVAEITNAAGLTHGSFYNHFESKEALFAETVTAALSTLATDLTALEQEDFPAYARAYLTMEHMASVGCGCPIAALGADAARETVEAQQAFARGLKEVMHAAVTSFGDRAEAIAALSTLVGAMVMARAVNGADPNFASEILKAPVAHIASKALQPRGRRKERRV